MYKERVGAGREPAVVAAFLRGGRLDALTTWAALSGLFPRQPAMARGALLRENENGWEAGGRPVPPWIPAFAGMTDLGFSRHRCMLATDRCQLQTDDSVFETDLHGATAGAARDDKNDRPRPIGRVLPMNR